MLESITTEVGSITVMLTTQRSDRVVLNHLSWQQFQNLLDDLGDNRSARIAYDNGSLEIMTPLPEHEYYKQAISIVIEDMAEVLEQDYECLGSSTWKREVKKAGIEPDNCFYFQNESLIRGKLVFDLDHDPPPDLALEIDLTSKSLDRFPIYARLGVPEIWCYDSGVLKIYQLEQGTYLEQSQSLIFPTLKIQEIPDLIEAYRYLGRRKFRQAVREWVKEQNP
jgi:Uma2 family endonuclease